MLNGLAALEDDGSFSKQPESVAAVLKVFALLQILAERGEAGLSELSIRLAMPKATVHRFMQTMVKKSAHPGTGCGRQTFRGLRQNLAP